VQLLHAIGPFSCDLHSPAGRVQPVSGGHRVAARHTCISVGRQAAAVASAGLSPSLRQLHGWPVPSLRTVSGYASQLLTREQSNLEVRIPCRSQLRQAIKYEGTTTIMPG
jgi:hypothetical protein